MVPPCLTLGVVVVLALVDDAPGREVVVAERAAVERLALRSVEKKSRVSSSLLPGGRASEVSSVSF